LQAAPKAEQLAKWMRSQAALMLPMHLWWGRMLRRVAACHVMLFTLLDAAVMLLLAAKMLLC